MRCVCRDDRDLCGESHDDDVTEAFVSGGESKKHLHVHMDMDMENGHAGYHRR